jgi:hypothetical protein
MTEARFNATVLAADVGLPGMVIESVEVNQYVSQQPRPSTLKPVIESFGVGQCAWAKPLNPYPLQPEAVIHLNVHSSPEP